MTFCGNILECQLIVVDKKIPLFSDDKKLVNTSCLTILNLFGTKLKQFAGSQVKSQQKNNMFHFLQIFNMINIVSFLWSMSVKSIHFLPCGFSL